jgi:hypothetical protein
VSAPLVVNVVGGAVWLRQAAVRDGLALYAPEKCGACPEFVMVTYAELEARGIVGSADVLPVPVGPEPQALSVERLAEIEVRERAAFAGPWYTDTCTEHDGSTSIGVVTASDAWIVPLQDLDPDDAEFMAHARSDVPVLVAEVRRQAAQIAELEAQRERRRVRLVALQNDALSMRGSLSPMGEERKVPLPLGETLTPAVDWLIGRVAELERTVRQMVDGLNGHDCPPPDESPMGAVTRFAVRLMEAERLLAEDGCSCPPVDRTHQIGCPLDGVPVPGPDAVTTSYTATPEAHAQMRAALTRHFAGEPGPEFYGLVHHDWRIGRDLPETGGTQ